MCCHIEPVEIVRGGYLVLTMPCCTERKKINIYVIIKVKNKALKVKKNLTIIFLLCLYHCNIPVAQAANNGVHGNCKVMDNGRFIMVREANNFQIEFPNSAFK